MFIARRFKKWRERKRVVLDEGPFPLFDLPPEIIVKVLTNLNSKDFQAWRSVSAEVRNMIGPATSRCREGVELTIEADETYNQTGHVKFRCNCMFERLDSRVRRCVKTIYLSLENEYELLIRLPYLLRTFHVRLLTLKNLSSSNQVIHFLSNNLPSRNVSCISYMEWKWKNARLIEASFDEFMTFVEALDLKELTVRADVFPVLPLERIIEYAMLHPDLRLELNVDVERKDPINFDDRLFDVFLSREKCIINVPSLVTLDGVKEFIIKLCLLNKKVEQSTTYVCYVEADADQLYYMLSSIDVKNGKRYFSMELPPSVHASYNVGQFYVELANRALRHFVLYFYDDRHRIGYASLLLRALHDDGVCSDMCNVMNR